MDVPIKSLRLDGENPRLPASLRGGDQAELATVLEMGFEAYAVAQSIADHGYFMSEPMLVIASPVEKDAWIVVEGNRRLTALLGLTNEKIRGQFADSERWDALVGRSRVSSNSLVPVVLHPDRKSTHVEVARAHVIGKLAWRPYAQATYIAARVAEGRTFAEVAELLGVTKSKVADLYRDQAIVKQSQNLGLTTGEIEKAFSLLTVTMSNTKLRDHIGAPLGSRLEPGTDPIPAEKTENLAELITWIFGSEEAEPKITDSRQISQLGNVVASDVGLKALRAGDSLEQAKTKLHAAGLSPLERLLNRLTTAKSALLYAADDLSDHAHDATVRDLVDDIEAALGALSNTIEEIEQTRAEEVD
ncbi:MAG: hypothetical protein EXR68_00180 [Dehalococcoidia bacterium]|nr:hypothetical protein [Dehalococcoidia bacterium]